MQRFQHNLALAGAIVAGAVLRFWHLDFKPLWMDEAITALFSQGNRYDSAPLDVLFPLDRLQQIFALKPQASCSLISSAVAAQSTHPPLFFCLTHQWLNWLAEGRNPTGQFHALAWDLRSLPALFGVCGIVAIYLLNRAAFSPAAGLMAAAVMAVSPFGVYLSQEARHYTLPVLLIALALLALILLQQDLRTLKLRPAVWLGWVAVNSIGFYTHYFFLLVFAAQIATLLGLLYQLQKNADTAGNPQSPAGKNFPIAYLSFCVVLAIAGVGICLIPWLQTLLSHSGRSETGWLPPPHNIAPLYQTLVGWLTMVIVLPVEKQPLWVQIPAILLMLAFGTWLARLIWHPLKVLSSNRETQLATRTLLSFTFWVLLELFTIVYLLRKDMTVAFRYHFVYYPAVCALLGAGVWKAAVTRQHSEVTSESNPLKKRPETILEVSRARAPFIILIAGAISCAILGSDLAFKKPFFPDILARDVLRDSSAPIVFAVGYNDLQDVALGLSFALEIDRRSSKNRPQAYLAFLQRNTTAGEPAAEYKPVWQNLSQLENMPAPPLNLWVVAPGLKPADYPQQLSLRSPQKPVCARDEKGYRSVGVPYQHYRCR
ncbi:glycosyltransferase family 39 protein [Kamptonema formosum]|uniref:glycosyltransferase family 39 protein n=1 Tax=Kamptonema formosum TaxID=331992 RepID=UPI00034BC7CD|nr:glycosyltransferase family 39 protein [Oscillatoria sp. PCC 10802]